MSRIELRSQLKRPGFRLNVDLEIPDTGITVFFGPSGSGKSTLLRALAGLERLPDTEVRWGERLWQSDQRFIPAYKRDLGMVFQNTHLFAHLNVEQNLRYGMRRAANPASKEGFDELIELLGLHGLLNRAASSLSGGEQQRVAIARALLMQPALLLMDEPLSALDADNKAEILPYLERLHQRLSIPLIYVTHDLAEMARLGDHLVLLNEGAVMADGKMSDLLGDPDLPLASRPDALMQFDLPVARTDPEFAQCELQFNRSVLIEFACSASQPGGLTRILIQAQDISLSTQKNDNSTLNQIPVVVKRFWFVSKSHAHILLRAEDKQSLVARITRKSVAKLDITPGKQLIASIKTAAIRGTPR